MPGAVLVAVAAILLWHTFDPSYSSRLSTLKFGPVFFPRVILTVWLLLSLPLIFVVPRALRRSVLEHRKVWPGVFFVFALAIYLWLLPGLGYLLATFLFGAVVQLIAGDRKPLRFVFWSAVLTVMSWVCFELGLEIILPAGKWL
ncbi:tripartite tricarboxylate transporter TctB family protein [Amorphus sp. 3PC139-8]|uniref:tripartite tricarboxylate transporter TctB family protein n=1 Tax=Amorphus sp. 3PC139-8 TaxID=2735676 RepID=UPI00345DF519